MPTKKTGSKKHTSTKKLSDKQSFSSQILAFFVLIFAAVGGYILLTSHAAPAQPNMYLTTNTGFTDAANGFVKPGSTFTVQLWEDSSSTTVLSYEADISYNTSLLTYVSTSYTGTSFSNPATIPASASGGVLSIVNSVSCGTTCSNPLSGVQLLATITFQAAATGGNGSLAFLTGAHQTAVGKASDGTTYIPNTAPLTVSVDSTAPTVSVTAPANNSTQKFGNTVSTTFNPADNDKVSTLDIYIDTTKVTSLTSSPWSYSWNTSTYSLGSHTIKAIATDPSGNATTSSVVTVNLTDQTAPSAPGSFHMTGTTQTTVNLAWTASTDDVGVTNYKLSRNGSLIATLTPATLTYQDTGLTNNTTYNYSITAVDAAANASTASTTSATTTNYTTGDINKDGKVDGSDLAFLASVWKTANVPADLNQDGIVDLSDLTLLLLNFGH